MKKTKKTKAKATKETPSEFRWVHGPWILGEDGYIKREDMAKQNKTSHDDVDDVEDTFTDHLVELVRKGKIEPDAESDVVEDVVPLAPDTLDDPDVVEDPAPDAAVDSDPDVSDVSDVSDPDVSDPDVSVDSVPDVVEVVSVITPPAISTRSTDARITRLAGLNERMSNKKIWK